MYLQVPHATSFPQVIGVAAAFNMYVLPLQIWIVIIMHNYWLPANVAIVATHKTGRANKTRNECQVKQFCLTSG